MDINWNVEFIYNKNTVKCRIAVDGKYFECTKRITKEADRISPVKRAKQLAYCGCAVKVHGYVCNRLIKEQ